MSIAFINLINNVVGFYITLVFISVIMSWLVSFNVVNGHNRFVYLVMDFLYRVTEPALRPIRRILPNLGGLDISPIILIFILWFIRDLLTYGIAR
ncbi:MAG: YggT family protein [Sphingomonadales bacterium]